MNVTAKICFLKQDTRALVGGMAAIQAGSGEPDPSQKSLSQTPFLFPIYFHCQGISEEPGESFLPKEITLANW